MDLDSYSRSRSLSSNFFLVDLDSYLQTEVFLQKPPGPGPGDLVDSYSYFQAEVFFFKSRQQPACLLPCFVPSSHLFCFLMWRRTHIQCWQCASYMALHAHTHTVLLAVSVCNRGSNKSSSPRLSLRFSSSMDPPTSTGTHVTHIDRPTYAFARDG